MQLVPTECVTTLILSTYSLLIQKFHWRNHHALNKGLLIVRHTLLNYLKPFCYRINGKMIVLLDTLKTFRQSGPYGLGIVNFKWCQPTTVSSPPQSVLVSFT